MSEKELSLYSLANLELSSSDKHNLYKFNSYNDIENNPEVVQ
jgi:hypothetical protein